MLSYLSFWKEWMIHVNLQTQFHEQLEMIKSLRSDGKIDFDMGKCQSIQRVKGQLTVTDKLTVHEDQIIEVQCSKNPGRTSFAVMIRD